VGVPLEALVSPLLLVTYRGFFLVVRKNHKFDHKFTLHLTTITTKSNWLVTKDLTTFGESSVPINTGV